MSENKKKKQTETAPLIATIIVAVLAMAAVIVLLITINSADKNKQTEDNTPAVTTHQFSEEFVENCQFAAQDLVRDSYKVIRLFISEGLPHYDEPYGNEPDDGLYTVNSTDYSSLEDIENLVRSVYKNSEAERIMNLGVYKNRKVLVDIVYEDTTAEAAATAEDRPLYEEKEVLGISAAFTPDASANEGWTEYCSIAVMPKSETECELTISVGGSEDGSVAPVKTLETAMVKIEGEWKLASFVY